MLLVFGAIHKRRSSCTNLHFELGDGFGMLLEFSKVTRPNSL